jgi:hypothetical protein
MAEPQSTSRVLMIEPTQFRLNPETAQTNRFMRATHRSDAEVRARAQEEFAGLARALGHEGVQALIMSGAHGLDTPDAVFPNNWFSTHPDGTLVLYPMHAPSRRAERRPDILAAIDERFRVVRTVDLSPLEDAGDFIEGTGSLILDRIHRVAYVGLSSRAGPGGTQAFCRELGYRAITFPIRDANGGEIYHTNVMMSVGTRLAVVCLAAIADESARALVRRELESSGRRVIELRPEQIGAFCGNVLELRSRDGATVWAMSSAAWAGMTDGQRAALADDGRVAHAPIPTLEQLGGGSARCMIAELFLPEKDA